MPRPIQIRSASNRVNTCVAVDRRERQPAIYTPGQTITDQDGFMKLVRVNHLIVFKPIYQLDL